jgi:hypothetical protein
MTESGNHASGRRVRASVAPNVVLAQHADPLPSAIAATPTNPATPSATGSKPEAGALPPADARVVIDRDARLSKSKIWELLESYYQEANLDTWSSGDAPVPCYATCNTVIGDVYAELILSHLLDTFSQIQKDKPIYILELGAGSGAFSFYCLRALQRRLACSKQLRSLTLRYVMTDFTSNTVNGWDSVASFDEFRTAGILDSAVVWPERDGPIHLRRANMALERQENSVFVIANYFFDSLRADAFRISGRKLYETLYSFYKDAAKPHDPKRPFANISNDTKYRPAAAQYYESRSRNAVLRHYGQNYNELSLSMPVGAFDVIDSLRAKLGSSLVLLSSDKGFSTIDAMRAYGKHDFAQHGSVSFSVNYHAVAAYVAELGGHSLVSGNRVSSLHTLVSVLPSAAGGMPASFDMLTASFNARITQQDAINAALTVQTPFGSEAPAIPSTEVAESVVPSVVALVRTLHYDPSAYFRCGAYFFNCLPHLGTLWRGDVRKLMCGVEENIYTGLKQTRAILDSLAATYLCGKWYADAVRVLERARDLGDPSPRNSDMLATAYENLGRIDDAIACLEGELTRTDTEELTEAVIVRRTAIAVRLDSLRADPRCTSPEASSAPLGKAAEVAAE